MILSFHTSYKKEISIIRINKIDGEIRLSICKMGYTGLLLDKGKSFQLYLFTIPEKNILNSNNSGMQRFCVLFCL